MPDEHKHKANEHKDRARQFLSDEYFPPERRDQLIYRLKKVVIECQNHKDYQQSMGWLLNTVAEYTVHGGAIVDQGQCIVVYCSSGVDDVIQGKIRTSNLLRMATSVSHGTSCARCWSALPTALASTSSPTLFRRFTRTRATTRVFAIGLAKLMNSLA